MISDLSEKLVEQISNDEFNNLCKDTIKRIENNKQESDKYQTNFNKSVQLK